MGYIPFSLLLKWLLKALSGDCLDFPSTRMYGWIDDEARTPFSSWSRCRWEILIVVWVLTLVVVGVDILLQQVVRLGWASADPFFPLNSVFFHP